MVIMVQLKEQVILLKFRYLVAQPHMHLIMMQMLLIMVVAFEENNFSQIHTVFSWDNDISDYQVLFEVDFIEGMSFDYSDIFL